MCKALYTLTGHGQPRHKHFEINFIPSHLLTQLWLHSWYMGRSVHPGSPSPTPHSLHGISIVFAAVLRDNKNTAPVFWAAHETHWFMLRGSFGKHRRAAQPRGWGKDSRDQKTPLQVWRTHESLVSKYGGSGETPGTGGWVGTRIGDLKQRAWGVQKRHHAWERMCKAGTVRKWW